MRLSKKLMFAIEAVLDIAYNAGPQPVQSGEINDRQGIPRRYLEPVLQQLVRAGILEGVRGPRGGYRLARERRRITLADIAQAVKTTEAVSDPFDLPAGSALGQRVVRPVCMELADNWMQQLDSISIEDLCNRARELGVDSETREKADFAI
ncbi:RrF2 family transcriptional regulator [Roseiterribacter gracilis]|jgi:Rrf2 family transcriptional regulator, iron-sulfur cluster assembly transcription factor|uniref:Rrf2 family transcriptional regulator n=1 Tax=Roseiterribacter gracilis TaxID=2812848 RepID=A0A8S8X8Z8_9PROT|nr:transcriptional regulator [Rhodospirillales bacterium]GIL39204.1 Rrf2 family transcriptional regulator [Rhodospirillales bacterium TMPK1]